MLNYVRRVLHPDWYHGHGKKPPFFEGWYFKVINAAEDVRFAFIPGIFINQDPQKTHAFIQVLDGMAGRGYYHTLNVNAFEAAKDAFDVRIGDSHFRADGITVNIDDEVGKIRGELQFENLSAYPVTLTAPGIMGWYGWLPFMECNHGIVSLNHTIRGEIEIYGTTVDFTGGKGYTEKDWGQSFPTGYVWMQTNHFDNPNVSFTGSIATIPNLGLTFPGFIVALLVDGRLYRFTTYNNSAVDKLVVTDTSIEWVLYNAQHELRIHAQRAEGGLLKAPEKTDMHQRVAETLRASVELELNALTHTRKQTIFAGQGRNMGLEVVGDLGMLLKS
jgi:tocopherol cyclase